MGGQDYHRGMTLTNFCWNTVEALEVFLSVITGSFVANASLCSLNLATLVFQDSFSLSGSFGLTERLSSV